VIGLVRDKASTDAKLASDGLLTNNNITTIQADITSRASLLQARAQIATLTSNSLDCLINNAALVSQTSEYKTLADFDDDPELLESELLDTFNTNVIGVINTINVMMTLIKKGGMKKVIVISTGMADLDAINTSEIDVSGPYSISKGAVNVAVAKYNASYKEEGVLFLAISPGLVDTGNSVPRELPFPPFSPFPFSPSEETVLPPHANPSPAPQGSTVLATIFAKFAKYAPHFTGPITPEESVKAVLKVIDNASIEKGDGGAFISHLGNKQWL
jgi:NAD(P)-dependent dehydrogenase (short-subunit alcohol dehydrogenase family)